MIKNPSRCVYIGNIHNNLKKEELRQLCESIAPVYDFRMVVKKQKDFTRSFAFCEYYNLQDSLKAMTILQGKDILGRKLKINYAENPSISGKNIHKPHSNQGQQNFQQVRMRQPPPVMNQPMMGGNMPMRGMPMMQQGIPQMRMPNMPNPFVQQQMMQQMQGRVQAKNIDPIYQLLSLVPKQTLLDTLIHLKNMIQTDLNTAKSAFVNNPNAANVVLYMLHIAGLKIRSKEEKDQMDKSLKALSQLSQEQITRLPPELQRKVFALRQRYQL